jgi:hypothetical protein
MPLWNPPAIGGPIAGATAGSVLFAATGGLFAQDNANFQYVDADNSLALAAAPPASAAKSLLRLGNAISGGNAAGTYLGINAPSGYTGDTLFVQLNGVTQFQVNAQGSIAGNELRIGSPPAGGAWTRLKTPDSSAPLRCYDSVDAILFEVDAGGQATMLSLVVQDPPASGAWTRLKTPDASAPLRCYDSADAVIFEVDAGGAMKGEALEIQSPPAGGAWSKLKTPDSSAILRCYDSSDAILFEVGAAAIGFFGVTAAARDTGWTLSNVGTDRTFDADSLTLDELADVVGTVVNRLIAFGLFGT